MTDEFPKPVSRPKNPILDQDDYLEKLEWIIKRDFYPELYKMDKLKSKQQLNGEVQDNLTLNQFLSTYTSDENVILNEIIKKENDKWLQKNAWMFKAEEQHQQKQKLALESSKLQNMIEGNKNNNLQLNEYSALNPIYFKIDQSNEKIQPAIESAHKQDLKLRIQQVDISNTRFDDHHKPFEFAMSAIHNKLKKREIQEKLNAQGVNIDQFGTTPNLVGVQRQADDNMIGLYSPAPHQLKTPLMTWGEVSETPVRLERSYMIPPSPARDQIGNTLAQQLNIRKKNEQKQQEELLKKRLSSMTPYQRMGSVLSSRANSELMKNYFQTPLSSLSKKINKQTPQQVVKPQQ